MPYINAAPRSDGSDEDEEDEPETDNDSDDDVPAASTASAADLQPTEGEENTVGDVEAALAFVHKITRRWCTSLRKACECLTLAELSRENMSDSGCSNDKAPVAAVAEEDTVDISSTGSW